MGSLVIACGAFFTLEGGATVSAGNGYTMDKSFNGNDGAEHLNGFVGSGTTSSPFQFNRNVMIWSEVSASFVG